MGDALDESRKEQKGEARADAYLDLLRQQAARDAERHQADMKLLQAEIDRSKPETVARSETNAALTPDYFKKQADLAIAAVDCWALADDKPLEDQLHEVWYDAASQFIAFVQTNSNGYAETQRLGISPVWERVLVGLPIGAKLSLDALLAEISKRLDTLYRIALDNKPWKTGGEPWSPAQLRSHLEKNCSFATVAGAGPLPVVAEPSGPNGGRPASDSRGAVYKLYRNSPLENVPHIHMATFDAIESEDFNRINCLTVVDLFNQEAIKKGVRFWCERSE